MSRKQLPKNIKITVLPVDLENAICGSPTSCAIARSLIRSYPSRTYVKVNPNLVTLSINGLTHHFTLPKKALDLIGMNDDDTLFLAKQREKDRTLKLTQVGKPVVIPISTDERRARINKARDARKAAGKPDKNYPRVMRHDAAKAAGVLYKKVTSRHIKSS